MFDREIIITGEHSNKVKYLVNEAQIYSRYLDVYLNGVVIGLLYNQRQKKEISVSETAKIFAEQVIGASEELIFLYRLVMLLDCSSNLTEDERIERAFKDDALQDNQQKMKLNMELFNEYANGGISILYDYLCKGNIELDSYIDTAYSLIKSFENQNNDSIEKEINEIIYQ
ncbi:MAG: hypothetical protein RSD51_03180 [Malacoplasma sp.]